MTTKRVRAFAPATVANVAAAFDILGFAMLNPGDIVEVQRAEEPGVRIQSISGDGGVLPLVAEKNTAGFAIQALLTHIGDEKTGIDIHIEKGLALCSGLGSSAASSAAAVVAANILLGEPLSIRELLPFVVAAEGVACGTAHADNAAPSLLGGFCLVRSTNPLDVVELPVPQRLHCAVVHPHCEVRTEDARKVLRTRVELTQAVRQWGNVAGLIAGLCLDDLELIARSLHDELVEPIRSLLIPGFQAVKASALKAGALGCSISGSGPTVFALCDGEERAKTISKVMAEAFGEADLDSDVFVSALRVGGARVIDEEK